MKTPTSGGPQEHGAERFVDAGVNANRVRTDLQRDMPITTSSLGVGPHVGLGARRAVSANNDLGVRVEFDEVDGHSLIGVRAIDYRYRFARPTCPRSVRRRCPLRRADSRLWDLLRRRGDLAQYSSQLGFSRRSAACAERCEGSCSRQRSARGQAGFVLQNRDADCYTCREDFRAAPAVLDQTSHSAMRIMHIILSRGFAGSERYAAELASFQAAEHDVMLIVRRTHRSRFGTSVVDAVSDRVHVSPVPTWLRTQRAVEQRIREFRPDVIHTHLRRSGRIVARAQADAPSVATLHNGANGPHFFLTRWAHLQCPLAGAADTRHVSGTGVQTQSAVHPSSPRGRRRNSHAARGRWASDPNNI